MSKVAVVLSGCGVYDGAEVQESVITLLCLARRGETYQCMAPDVQQLHVINHLTGEVMEGQARNVREEAARIARGDVMDLRDADPADYSALLVPGGFGAAKNLSDFAVRGSDMAVQADFLRFARSMHDAGRPIGLICIAPAMAPRIFGEGVSCTIGDDVDTAAAIEAMGGRHVSCPVRETVIDRERKLVSTPAYMLAQDMAAAAAGIERLVDEVLALR